MQVKSQKFFNQVYDIVRKIPEGKVRTYGQIAKIFNASPRTVGWALHANKDSSKVSCHRVVNKEGRIAPGYAFGGPDEQKNKLLSEGAKFIDDHHVDLVRCLWSK